MLGIQAIEGDTSETDVPERSTWSIRDPVSSDHIPQQDNLDRIFQVMRLVASGIAVTPSKMGMKEGTDKERGNSKRHIDYMKHGAKVLGLLSDSGVLTPAGETLVMLTHEKAMKFLSLQFQATIVGRAWINWSNVREIEELDPDSAVEFLRERAVCGTGKNQGKPLTDSMLERRGRTLRKWVEEFKSLAPQPVQQAAEADSRRRRFTARRGSLRPQPERRRWTR